MVTGSSLPLTMRTCASRVATSERSWIREAVTPCGSAVAEGTGRAESAHPESTREASTSATTSPRDDLPPRVIVSAGSSRARR